MGLAANPYSEPRSSSRLNKIDPYHPPGLVVHFRDTIIWEILPEVTFFTLVATGRSLPALCMTFLIDFAVVCLVNSQYKSNALQLPTLLITVLGTVLGFIIVSRALARKIERFADLSTQNQSYRTSSAQERYNEGRKLWSNVIQATRSFSRIAWIHVPNAFSLRPQSEIPEEEVVRALIVRDVPSIKICGHKEWPTVLSAELGRR